MQTDETLARATRYARQLHVDANAIVLAWHTALDNYPVPRSEAYGYGVEYAHRGYYRAVVLWGTDFGPVGGPAYEDLLKSLILVDDGDSVRPMYVAGYNPTYNPGAVFFHPFPLDRGTRPDNGQPVDMSGWRLGPRKAYHLKARQYT